MTEREEQIRELARRLWEMAGHPKGMDLEFWLEAERRYDRFHRYVVQERPRE